jgi:hypothetical protein
MVTHQCSQEMETLLSFDEESVLMRKMTNIFGDRLVGKTIIAFTALPFISVYTMAKFGLNKIGQNLALR